MLINAIGILQVISLIGDQCLACSKGYSVLLASNCKNLKLVYGSPISVQFCCFVINATTSWYKTFVEDFPDNIHIPLPCSFRDTNEKDHHHYPKFLPASVSSVRIRRGFCTILIWCVYVCVCLWVCVWVWVCVCVWVEIINFLMNL